jgi:LytS/YehU family sensor histidine kinase
LNGTSIEFADELDNINIYMSIEKERFGKKMNFNQEIRCASFKIPP